MKGQRYQKKLVKPHPTLLRLVQENKDIRAYVRVTPMLVKPDEWTQEKDGGPLDKSRSSFPVYSSPLASHADASYFLLSSHLHQVEEGSGATTAIQGAASDRKARPGF